MELGYEGWKLPRSRLGQFHPVRLEVVVPLFCSKEVRGLPSPRESFLLRRGRGCSRVGRRNRQEMLRAEAELWDTLRFSFRSTSKGSIIPGLQQVPEDPEKAQVGLPATGRIRPRKNVLILNEVPTGRACEVCASTKSPSKVHV